MLKGSSFSLDQWLFSLSFGLKPNGDLPAGITKINDGDVVEIWTEGYQSFGSGGFSAGAVYAGNKPEKVGSENSRSTGFISEACGQFKITAPSVLYEQSSDCIGEGRLLRDHVIICATEAQIQEAKNRVLSEPLTEEERAEVEAFFATDPKEKWFQKGEVAAALREDSSRRTPGWEIQFLYCGRPAIGLFKLAKLANMEDRLAPLIAGRNKREKEAADKKAMELARRNRKIIKFQGVIFDEPVQSQPGCWIALCGCKIDTHSLGNRYECEFHWSGGCGFYPHLGNYYEVVPDVTLPEQKNNIFLD